MLGYKTNKVDWLDQVEDEWDKLLFQEAVNWTTKEVPEELKTRLSDKLETDVMTNKKPWFSLLVEGVSLGLEG